MTRESSRFKTAGVSVELHLYASGGHGWIDRFHERLARPHVHGDTRLTALAKMKHLLFICSQNKLRSPTAEAVFAGMPGIDVDSAGLNNDAVVPLASEQVVWADVIFVMEKTHREKLTRKFKRHLNRQRVIVLGIPDNYAYMEPALVELLKAKVTPYL